MKTDEKNAKAVVLDFTGEDGVVTIGVLVDAKDGKFLCQDKHQNPDIGKPKRVYYG